MSRRDVRYLERAGRPRLYRHRRPAVAVKLRRARIAIGMTQTELARRIGTSQPHLSAVECGRRVASLPLIRRVARVSGVPVRDLVE